MPLPNFLIVGAAKAGTTSLYKYLAQHPQIFMSPRKEPRYFAPEYYTTYYRNSIGNTYKENGMSLEEYRSLFTGVTDELAIGEASTEYLYFEKSAARIKEMLPNAKIIIILRDPVERAFSAYCYHVRDGRESLSFEESLDQEPVRVERRWQVGWFYRKGGLYYEQVRRYYKLFDPRQIKIIVWKNLNQDPQKVCSELFNFLGVDPTFKPDLSRSNRSLSPRSKFMNRHLFQNRKLKKWIKAPFPEELYLSFSSSLKKIFYSEKKTVNPRLKERLRSSYYSDIHKLEELTSIDLSHWKESE